MTVRFKARVSASGWVSGTEWVATVAPGHTVTKVKYGWSGGSSRVMCEFKCTCGWESATAVGVSNSTVEWHQKKVLRGDYA